MVLLLEEALVTPESRVVVRKYPSEECPISPNLDSNLDTGSLLDRDIEAKESRLLSLVADRIEVDIPAPDGVDTIGDNCSLPKN